MKTQDHTQWRNAAIGFIVMVLVGIWLISQGGNESETKTFTGACARYAEQMMEYGEGSVEGQAAAVLFIENDCESQVD